MIKVNAVNLRVTVGLSGSCRSCIHNTGCGFIVLDMFVQVKVVGSESKFVRYTEVSPAWTLLCCNLRYKVQ